MPHSKEDDTEPFSHRLITLAMVSHGSLESMMFHDIPWAKQLRDEGAACNETKTKHPVLHRKCQRQSDGQQLVKWCNFIPISQWLLLQNIPKPSLCLSGHMHNHAPCASLCLLSLCFLIFVALFWLLLRRRGRCPSWSLNKGCVKLWRLSISQHRLKVPYSAFWSISRHLSYHAGFEAVSEVYLLKRLSGTKTRTADFDVNMWYGPVRSLWLKAIWRAVSTLVDLSNLHLFGLMDRRDSTCIYNACKYSYVRIPAHISAHRRIPTCAYSPPDVGTFRTWSDAARETSAFK